MERRGRHQKLRLAGAKYSLKSKKEEMLSTLWHWMNKKEARGAYA